MAPRVGHVFKTMRERLEEKYAPDPNSGCWIWLGATNGVGYGTMTLGRSKRAYAHRVSFELDRGAIPKGMHLDHLCRNTFCINPQHLEPVSNTENTRRGKTSALRPFSMTCRRGHPLASSGYVDSQGRRQCRECLHLRQKLYYRRSHDGV